MLQADKIGLIAAAMVQITLTEAFDQASDKHAHY